MDIQGCIFDLDGVLVDTAKYHFKSWQKLAREKLGFDLEDHIEERLKGISRMASLDVILEVGQISCTNKEKEEMAATKNNWYLEFVMNMDEGEVLPGVIDFLEELKVLKIRMAVGSASKNAPVILERIRITDYFEAVIDGNMVTHSKPDPEVFIKAAVSLDLIPSKCIVFEDSIKGIEAAIDGQFRSVGVGDPKILTEADAVIPGFKDLSFSDVLTTLKKNHERLHH